MKRIVMIFVFLIAVYIPVFSYPSETVFEEIDGEYLIHKKYEVTPETDVSELMEKPFEHEGYTYKYSAYVKEDVWLDDNRAETQTVTLQSKTNSLEANLKLLEASVWYDKDGYTGALNLDIGSIRTEVEGYATKAHTISETKQYTGLERNDPYYVPKSIQKDGHTLNLTNTDWNAQGYSSYLMANTYTATATYSGTASNRYATGYIVTAEYKGEVAMPYLAKNIYTVTYAGKRIIPLFQIIIGILAAAISAAAAYLYINRSNVRM